MTQELLTKIQNANSPFEISHGIRNELQAALMAGEISQKDYTWIDYKIRLKINKIDG